MKLVLFFIVALLILIYFQLFWQNRHVKTHLHFFHQKVDINLGLLIFTVFLDGVILTLLMMWLLGFFG